MWVTDPDTGEQYEVPDFSDAPDPYAKGGVDYVGAPPPLQEGPPPIAPGKSWADLPPQPTTPAPGSPTVTYDPTTDTWKPTPAATPTPKPTPDPDPRGGNGGGGGGGGSTGYVPGTREYPIAGGATSFSYPDWVPPEENFNKTFTAPDRATPSSFAYPDFTLPTGDEVAAQDPGYAFRAQQQQQALRNERSAHGLLSTGSTLADLMTLSGNLASQEYGNAADRAKGVYDTNRNNKFSSWQANNQQDDNAFTRSLTSYLTGEQAKEADWSRSQQAYETNLQKAAAGYGLNLDTSSLNLNRDNSQFNNLLSLTGLMLRGMPGYSPVPVPTVGA